ncbi:adenosylmethionine-8-amino-7-oxononanoate aminotransferase [Variovorax boronicumulans]|uniref:Adenosylmethionine-8-amino-7-oxononanoate aminotransferase n=1 Tax=Variovorax boronicumulans TaxID=436515 RepID=A0AAW8CZ64_9BURK|nr:adenosylmethionine--8-amino-7-oxononanoate transaminase [Variovorax boronicumulans]MDP9895630.1 adenosylmethionine-8-amino-7-oxononanoate aminotransferase [Variovorax boronicumulans]MDQ0055662.1 adenosylmethionine-8-amino-7-oxononanoate aminotransferase [Variovorax boronicumulans]
MPPSTAFSSSANSSANTSWQQRSRRHVWHPCTQSIRLEAVPPLPIARGEGVWLLDHNGRRYLDATSSWWVNIFGHAHPAINAALKDQLDAFSHVMLAGCTHAPAVELAERLSALTGHALGHCFYASDGASAVEIALKMSFHAWRNAGRGGKQNFVALRHGYHGETLGALHVTDVPVFRDAYAPLLANAHLVASPDARAARQGEDALDVARRAAAELETLLAERHASIAAVIVEPLVQCATGMAMHDPEYLRLARALCDRYEVHLIADEIAVGCGRTGTFFACEQAGIWPDFLCLSKGISGGYLPLALVMTRDVIYEGFVDDDVARSFLHSHSYTGNALACRAALATLDLFEREDALRRNRGRAERLIGRLREGLQGMPVDHLRQRGMITAFDVREPGARFAERFHLAARANGLLMRPIGSTVYLMPPYVIGDDEIDRLVDGTLATLRSVTEPTHAEGVRDAALA